MIIVYINLRHICQSSKNVINFTILCHYTYICTVCSMRVFPLNYFPINFASLAIVQIWRENTSKPLGQLSSKSLRLMFVRWMTREKRLHSYHMHIEKYIGDIYCIKARKFTKNMSTQYISYFKLTVTTVEIWLIDSKLLANSRQNN